MPSSRVVAVVASGIAVLIPHAAAARPWDYEAAHDRYSLLDRRLVNRQLFQQVQQQPYRLGDRWKRVVAVSDLSIGTQQTFDGSLQSRYHGWFIADTFFAAKLAKGLEANFNVLALNPSASDGYRVSSQLTAELTLHAALDLFKVSGDAVHGELIGLDLGTVTVGNGLLLEQTPIEGAVALFEWRGVTLDVMYAGRALWDDDDLITTSLTAFDGRAKLTLAQWQKSRLPPAEITMGEWPEEFPDDAKSRYLSVAADLPLPANFGLAAEYAGRPRNGDWKNALLLRADYVGPGVGWLGVHCGYQFRYYQDGFGPRDRLWPPTWVFNTPYQEDAYVTNPFEYFGISERFEQWSHTTMFEVRLNVTDHFTLFTDAELWLRYARASTKPSWVVYGPDGFRAPGVGTNVHYDLGLRYFPWAALPHRASAFITNKQVTSADGASDPVLRRFDPGFYYVLEVEAHL